MFGNNKIHPTRVDLDRIASPAAAPILTSETLLRRGSATGRFRAPSARSHSMESFACCSEGVDTVRPPINITSRLDTAAPPCPAGRAGGEMGEPPPRHPWLHFENDKG